MLGAKLVEVESVTEDHYLRQRFRQLSHSSGMDILCSALLKYEDSVQRQILFYKYTIICKINKRTYFEDVIELLFDQRSAHNTHFKYS